MKITDLEHLRVGDFLIIKPIVGLFNPLVHREIKTLRVVFLGFQNGNGKKALLSRNFKTQAVDIGDIEVIGRYRPKP